MSRNNGSSRLPLREVKVTGSFWADRQKTVHKVALPYQWQTLNDNVSGAIPSNAVKNFRIAVGEAEGTFNGRPFQDSDVYKWLEAVGFYLTSEKDSELENVADDVIDLISSAQQPDGYLDNYFAFSREERWTNLRDLHELYCAGHLIEAAVAYFNGTGKDKLLQVACKLVDHIADVFGTERGQLRGYDGHEEIELALVKLHEVTKDPKHLKLSKFFIDERGSTPHFFKMEEAKRGETANHNYLYHQAHLPVRQQEHADGHAVRAVYLYSGMIDIAKYTGDESLYKACKTIWNNMIQRRMYITGGIGSIAQGEAFTFDYDLPNDKAYTETCAAIGLALFAHRMLQYELDSEYADTVEKIIFNGALSGISLDGKQYFYVNPLEVWPEAIDKREKENFKHRLRYTRQEWYGTACCPPNIARLISSLGQLIYTYHGTEIYTHLYVNSEANIEINGQKVSIVQQTEYPWDEKVMIRVIPEKQGEEFTLALRIPGWCRKASLIINGIEEREETLAENRRKGYVFVTRAWEEQDVVQLILHMPVELMQSNPNVRANAGKVAIQRGPLVYCLEEADNGPNLLNISIPRDAEFKTYFDNDLLGGVTVIETEAARENPDLMKEDRLYMPAKFTREQFNIKAMPYYAWSNRTSGEMLVWLRSH